MDSLRPTNIPLLEEVATSVLAIYHTLVSMQYLDREWIQEGPHDITELIPLYRSLGLDDSIIYLYHLLPYIDNGGATEVFWFKGGRFADFRIKEHVEEARDPFYSESEQNRCRPWMTALSLGGEEQIAIVYSAKKHCIWIIDGQNDANVDPGIVHGSPSMAGETGHAEVNTIWGLNCRPAVEVLRELDARYRTLRECPGSQSTEPEWAPVLVQPLYRKHGWLGNFDGQSFLVSQARAHASNQAESAAKQPLVELERRKMETYHDNIPRRQKLQSELSQASSVDSAWTAKWELWRLDYLKEEAAAQLRDLEQTANRLCPGGQAQNPDQKPMWELAQLKEILTQKRHNLTELQDDGDGEVTRERQRQERLRLKYAQDRVTVYERAFGASRADANRLCPGLNYTDIEGYERLPGFEHLEQVERLSKAKFWAEQDVEAIENWLKNVPSEAETVHSRASDLVDRFRSWIGDYESRIAIYSKETKADY